MRHEGNLTVRLPGLNGLRRRGQAVRRRWLRVTAQPQALILMYHRVVDLGSSANGLCVTPKHFAQHMHVLREFGRAVPLNQLVYSLRNGDLRHRTVAVTFDDGYADNLSNAKPLLEAQSIPATVFITTGNVGLDREFWWDELERVLLQPGVLPEVLRLMVQGRACEWQLNEAATYSVSECQRDRLWRIEQARFPGAPGHPSARLKLFDLLFGLIYHLPATEKEDVLQALSGWAGQQREARSTHRSLAPEELIRLAEGDLIEIGAHTNGHVALDTVSIRMQRDEILQSKLRLEEILSREVTAFSYPHGSYTTQAAAAAREIGLAYACTTERDTVWCRTDPFYLPRVYVPDENGEAFARRLELWLG